MMLFTSLLYNTIPIRCTPLRLHPPVVNTQYGLDSSVRACLYRIGIARVPCSVVIAIVTSCVCHWQVICIYIYIYIHTHLYIYIYICIVMTIISIVWYT